MRAFWRTASKKECVTKSEDDLKPGGLIPATTGISTSRRQERVVVSTRPDDGSRRFGEETRNPRAIDEDLLMEAFDNDDDSEIRITKESSARTVQPLSATQGEHASSVSSLTVALRNVKAASAKLHTQVVAWEEQAIQSGRAALRAKRQDPETGRAILSNDCKLHLLRRKLLKVNLAAAEKQRLCLEQSQQELEHELCKLRNEQKVARVSIQSLEQELKNVDIVEEILARDLTKDLFPDDDTVSAMDCSEDDLLHELQSLSSDATAVSQPPKKREAKASQAKSDVSKRKFVAPTLF